METSPKLLRKFLIGGADLANYTAGAKLNTDDLPLIEFNAPRNLFAAKSHTNQVSIVQHLGGAESTVPVGKMVATTLEGLKAPAMRLTVRTNGQLTEGDWQASWLVERQLPPARNKKASSMVVASRAMLAWQEEGATEDQVVSLSPACAAHSQRAADPSQMVSGTADTERKGNFVRRPERQLVDELR
jgi:hypothetical protein